MIKLNRLAEQCREVALRKHRITSDSSHRGLMKTISVKWRNLWNASPEQRSENLPKWSYCEETAADIIVGALTYLQSIGCKNIEQLIKDKAGYDEGHD